MGIISISVLVIVFFIVLAIYFIIVSHNNKIKTGAEGLIGKHGIVEIKVTKNKGKIFVNGEYWKAISSKDIAKDKKVVILKVLEDLVLKVKEV